ncbi:MAG: hypothetical protein ACOCXM_11800 [Myxococcota bacterium]
MTNDPCEEPGATRCAAAGEAVEICAEQDGCLVWVEDETCLADNECTGQPDVCEDGACVWSRESQVTCESMDEQCMPNVCDPTSGECEMSVVDDFEPCDDGDVCTSNDQCLQGSCEGENVCPADCDGPEDALVEDLACGDITEVTLGDGTDAMDGYGCEGARSGSTGWERTFRLQNTNPFDCSDMAITVELPDPDQKASDYVDVVALSREQGTCWPEDCLGVGFMDDEGRGALEMNLEAGADWNIVVDGRDGYAGDVRVAVNCCGSNVEAFCGNGVDDDGDGSPTDCADPDCEGSPVCEYEHACDNGYDDDDDGLTDCDDPDCKGLETCPVETDCDNGIDDDDDGLTDCEDTEDCGDEIVCGGGCPDAVILECGETLEGETLEGGVSEWAGETVPCGPNIATDFQAPHGLYGASIPNGCTAEFVVDASAGSLVADLVLNAPSCAMDACQDSGSVFFDSATLPIPDGLSPAWLGVSSEAGQTDEPFDVGLTCTCDE